MRLFKWEVLKILRDWKVRILLVALLLFLATYSTLYQDRTIKLPVEEAREGVSRYAASLPCDS